MAIRYSNLITLLLLTFSIALSYTFRQDNARSGYAGEEILPPLKKSSTFDIGALVVSSPCVVNDTLYIGARDSSVYCLYNGSLLWKFKTRGWIDATPAYYNGRIYAGSRDGLLYILDASTGDSLGAIFNGSTQCSSPLVYDSLVVFGAGGWAQDIRAQSIIGADNNVLFYTNKQMVYSSAALKDSIVVYGENGGSITALNAYTGTFIWNFQTNGGVYLSTPAISDQTVFFSPGNYDKYVYAFSLKTGQRLWESANSIEDTTTSANRYLFNKLIRLKPKTRKKMLKIYKKAYKTRPHEIEVLEPLTRRGVQNRSFIPLGGNATSSIAVGDSNVFVIHKEYGYPKPRFTITAFDKLTGEEKWYFSEQRNCTMLGFCSSPVITDSLVLFGWGEGKFYAFHTFTGVKFWEDSLDGDILSSPAVENGKIYVATTTGQIVTYVPGPEPVNFKESTFCYPNPARGSVSHIQLYVTKSATVKVTIYNANEKPVLRFSKKMDADEKYTYNWDIKNIANGVYFALVDVKYAGGGKDKKILKIAVLH